MIHYFVNNPKCIELLDNFLGDHPNVYGVVLSSTDLLNVIRNRIIPHELRGEDPDSIFFLFSHEMENPKRDWVMTELGIGVLVQERGDHLVHFCKASRPDLEAFIGELRDLELD